MSTLVECDTALDRHGNEIHIRDAPSGAKGYYCRSCGAEMAAHQKRRRNEAHFQHRPRFAGEVFDCLWSNESYRHKTAKRLIQQSGQLKLPALHALRPDDYEGPVPRILEAEVFFAHEALVERCVFEDSQGRPRFAHALEYDEDPSDKVLLVRPDLVFRNADGHPVLFVEICVTHTPDDRKLARLMRLQVPTVEIQIPGCNSEKELAHFLTHNTSHSRWLYHPKQYVYQPDLDNPLSTGRRGRGTVSNKRRLFGLESLKCRIIRVEDALRGVRKFLAGVEHTERRTAATARLAELGAEETRLEGIVHDKQGKLSTQQQQIKLLIAAAEADLAPTYRATNATVQRRVAKMRNDYRAAEENLAREAIDLAYQEADYQADLTRRLQTATAAVRATAAQEAGELDQRAAALRAHWREHDRLCEEEARLSRQEAELSAAIELAQTTLERARSAREQQEWANSQATNLFATAYNIENQLAERKRFLAKQTERAYSGRLAFK